jgi:hypothetical protein
VVTGPDPSVTRIAGPWRHHDVHANGIRFHCVEAVADPDDDSATTTKPQPAAAAKKPATKKAPAKKPATRGKSAR